MLSDGLNEMSSAELTEAGFTSVYMNSSLQHRYNCHNFIHAGLMFQFLQPSTENDWLPAPKLLNCVGSTCEKQGFLGAIFYCANCIVRRDVR